MFHFYLLTFSSSAQTAVISLGHNCVSVTMWAAPFEVFLLWLSPKPQPWSKNPSFIHLSSGLSQFKKTHQHSLNKAERELDHMISDTVMVDFIKHTFTDPSSLYMLYISIASF